jgi:hypothetical protein
MGLKIFVLIIIFVINSRLHCDICNICIYIYIYIWVFLCQHTHIHIYVCVCVDANKYALDLAYVLKS